MEELRMAWQARDPAFVERVRTSFERQRFMGTLGARLGHVAAGEVDIELPVADTLMPAGAAVLSFEFKINMLEPARGRAIVARGRVVRAGRTISVCRADALALGDAGEKLVATLTGTMMCVEGRNFSG